MNKALLTYCSINKKGVYVDGNEVFAFDSTNDIQSNLKLFYKSLNIDYSKVYKMDLLSKLGVLAVEAMKSKNTALFPYEDDGVSVLLFNSYSSLDTDAKHQEAVNKKSPSPAVFVYTLPNIVIGEISIRNKWYGESAFFVTEKPSPKHMMEQLVLQQHQGKSEKALIGWIDCFGEEYKCNLALISLKDELTNKDLIKEIIN